MPRFGHSKGLYDQPKCPWLRRMLAMDVDPEKASLWHEILAYVDFRIPHSGTDASNYGHGVPGETALAEIEQAEQVCLEQIGIDLGVSRLARMIERAQANAGLK